MTLETLNEAIREAERFIRLAHEVGKKQEYFADGSPYTNLAQYTKESAACRRASMDLTRALARLRKG